MVIKVTCTCGKQFRAKDKPAGAEVACPACGQLMAVPRSSKQLQPALQTNGRTTSTKAIPDASESSTEDSVAEDARSTGGYWFPAILLVLLAAAGGAIVYWQPWNLVNRAGPATEEEVADLTPTRSKIRAIEDPAEQGQPERKSKLLGPTVPEPPPPPVITPPAKTREQLEVERIAREKQAAEDARRKQAEDARRKQEAEEQRATHFKRLMDEGKAALEAGQSQTARKAFADASKLYPDNLIARDGLRRAEDAYKESLAEARRKQEEQREAEFRDLLAQGQASSCAKQYAAAFQELSKALKINPKDETANTALKEAQAGLAQEAEEKKLRVAEAHQAITKGRRALRFNDLEMANENFQTAARLAPDDPEVKKALLDLDKARAESSPEALARKKQQEEQERKTREEEAKRKLLAMQEQEKKAREDAARKIREAEEAKVRAQADQEKKARDEEARKKLLAMQELEKKAREEQAKLEQERKAREEEAKRKAQEEEAKRKAAEKPKTPPKGTKLGSLAAVFAEYMEDGQKALKEKRYEDAVKAFEEALKLSPDHPEATKLLKQAKEALPAGKS